MSYIAESEEIEPSVEKILEGMEEFKQASYNRRNHNYSEWSDSHLDHLIDIEKMLLDIEMDLRKLL